MRPENFLHRIGDAFVLQDIDFATHPEFSKSYLLEGSDESTIRQLFSSHVLRFFSQEKAWSVEGTGEWLVVYTGAGLVPAEQLEQFLSMTSHISSLFSSPASPSS